MQLAWEANASCPRFLRIKDASTGSSPAPGQLSPPEVSWESVSWGRNSNSPSARRELEICKGVVLVWCCVTAFFDRSGQLAVLSCSPTVHPRRQVGRVHRTTGSVTRGPYKKQHISNMPAHSSSRMTDWLACLLACSLACCSNAAVQLAWTLLVCLGFSRRDDSTRPFGVRRLTARRTVHCGSWPFRSS